MKVYTRGGDRGETSLFGGRRVRKDDLRVEAYGAVDELNAALGVAGAAIDAPDLRQVLERLQRDLFNLGAELATPDVAERAARGKPPPRVRRADIEALEALIDRLDAELEPLRSFVLPGGAPAAAALHAARTVCRRAERESVRLAAVEALAPELLGYLNRLSDLLFVMARVANRRAGVAELRWQGRAE